MKLKFDENISPRLVDAVRRLETDTGIEIGSVREDYGSGTPDPDWMYRFRADGGTAMISGDHRILQKPVNLLAYTDSELISIWPSSGWPELRRWGQSALLIRWWPVIKARIKSSKPGDRWGLPMGWTPSEEAFRPLRDPRIDRKS